MPGRWAFQWGLFRQEDTRWDKGVCIGGGRFHVGGYLGANGRFYLTFWMYSWLI